MTSPTKTKPKMVDTIWGKMTEDKLHALQDQMFEDDEERREKKKPDILISSEKREKARE